MKFTSILLLILTLSSCTISFINSDAEGSASDVIDSKPSQSTDAKPSLTVPVSAV